MWACLGCLASPVTWLCWTIQGHSWCGVQGLKLLLALCSMTCVSYRSLLLCLLCAEVRGLLASMNSSVVSEALRTAL